MIKFKIYSLWQEVFITLSLSLLFSLVSCTKDDTNTPVYTNNAIRFAVEDIALTKVVYDNQADGGISAKFTKDDKIGVFAFYNNFYYYYTQYNNFAESVIFANQELKIDATPNGTDPASASYERLRSWTFSTIYGKAPHTLDVVAYYPYEAYNNPKKHTTVTHDDTGLATIHYNYVGHMGESTEDTKKVNSDIDFMIATERYDYSSEPEETRAATFRAEMLKLDYIPLTFTRQLASLNFKITKPNDHEAEIIVTGLTVHFISDTKFTQTIPATKDPITGEDIDPWSGKELITEPLQTSITCNKTLNKTSWYIPPKPEDGISVENTLLTNDKRLFFPPDTDIEKIVFTLTDGGEAKTYTWHPHIATIVANTNYVLNLELDPIRKN